MCVLYESHVTRSSRLRTRATMLSRSGIARKSPSTRHVWSAALLQVKSESDRLVCANVFGLCWSFAPGQDGMSCALFLRLARVWTQTYLPVHAGVGRNYISDLELGKKEIGLRDLHLLAQSFGVTLVRLVHGL